jgi:hypothetical protein
MVASDVQFWNALVNKEPWLMSRPAGRAVSPLALNALVKSTEVEAVPSNTPFPIVASDVQLWNALEKYFP